MTKYINGNGTALGGIIIDAGTFDWTNGKFPRVYRTYLPDITDLVYSEALEAAAFIAKVRIEGLRDLGGAISPFNAWQIIQGLETLDLRVQKHSKSALELATWLKRSRRGRMGKLSRSRSPVIITILPTNTFLKDKVVLSPLVLKAAMKAPKK